MEKDRKPLTDSLPVATSVIPLPSLLSLSSPQDSFGLWRIYTKAKGALLDGQRMENISWRMYHMQTSESQDSAMSADPLKDNVKIGDTQSESKTSGINSDKLCTGDINSDEVHTSDAKSRMDDTHSKIDPVSQSSSAIRSQNDITNNNMDVTEPDILAEYLFQDVSKHPQADYTNIPGIRSSLPHTHPLLHTILPNANSTMDLSKSPSHDGSAPSTSTSSPSSSAV
jgi:Fungal protein of unknown function (DUF1752)